MAITYLAIPQVQVLINSNPIAGFKSATVTKQENNYDVAAVTFNNLPVLYPSTINIGDSITLKVRDGAVGGAYITIFNGTVLFPDYTFGAESIVVFQCVSLGYALAMMNVAEEYGTQSRNPTADTITEILTDASVGIIPKWVNKYKGGTKDSGYGITTTNVENLTESMPYICFPWKPADKSLNDLCDLNTAISATSSLAGPHWIIDDNGDLRLKRIGATQTGWAKYYGNSQSNATLVSGIDFVDGDFQPVGKEANVILYYGTWRRPSNGDAWTEGSASTWDHTTSNVEVTDESTIKIIGQKSIRAERLAGSGGYFWYPAAKDASWDFTTNFSAFNIPTLNFYARRSSDNFGDIAVTMIDNAGNGYNYSLISKITKKDIFYHFSIPLGDYANQAESNDYAWTRLGAANWTNIKYIDFGFSNNNTNEYLYIDGLHFGGAAVCRIAREKFLSEGGTLGESTNPIRFKVIRDNVGKDDSLKQSDDSGLIAQLAKSALLTYSKETVNGKFSTRLIPNVLPGQYWYIGGDWRIKKLTHQLGGDFKTAFEVTDDLTNSTTRLRYEDVNKTYMAIRPEWQDRQAASIKTGDMDIRITPLEVAYDT